DNDYVTFSLMSGGSRKTGYISLEVVADNVLSGIGRIEDVGEGWRRLTVNCSDLTLDGGDGTETINKIYFHWVNHGVMIRNADFVDEYSVDTFVDSGSVTGFSCSNFAYSDKALTFEYKPVGSRLSGDSDDVTFSLMSGWDRLTVYITVDITNNTVRSNDVYIGQVEDALNGWYKVTINFSEMFLNNATGTETVDRMNFHWVNHGFMLANFDIVNAYHDGTEISAAYGYTASDFSIENFATSGKALTFEYKPVGDRLSGDSDDVTFSLMSGWDRLTAYITVDITNNTVRSNDVYIGRVEDAGDGWYRVIINFSDMPLNATGNETVNHMYFQWVNHGFLLSDVSVRPCYTVSLSGAGADSTGAGSYSIGESITVTPGTKTNAEFVEWRINDVQVSTNPSYTFILSGNITLTAVFIDNYTVTVKNGTGGGTYADGSEITVTANTISGKTFREWTVNGEVVSTNSSYTFTVEEDVTIMAEYVLTLSANARVSSGEWSKFVNVENWKTSGKLFIMDYKPSTTSGSFEVWLETTSNTRVASAITVQYSGSSSVGYVDDIGDGWYRLTIELNNMGIRSGYNGTETLLQVALRSFTSGTSVDFYGINTSDDATYYTVSLEGAGNESTGAGTYLAGRSVTVTSGIISGKTFTEWQVGGVQVSTDSSYTFTPSGNITLTAVFVDVDICTVTVTNGTGGGTYEDGSEITVTANTPAEGYYFLYWKDGNNEIVSRDVSYIFTVTEDVELTANYRAYDGTYYSGAASFRLNTPTDKTYSAVYFEYKFSKAVEEIRFAITGGGDESTYYGAYFLSANGIAAPGMTTTTLNDGYIRVYIVFDLLTSHTETLPSRVANIKFNKSGNNVYFRNVLWEESPSFSMANGASIRLGSPNGIKFMAKIPFSLYDSEAEYGMIILPYDLIEGIDGFDFDADIISQLDEAGVLYRRFGCIPIETAGVGYIIQASIVNIKPQNLERDFIGIGFKYKNETYTYAEFSEDIEGDNIRSVSYVADKFLFDHDNFIASSEGCQDYVMGILDSTDVLGGGKLTINAFDSIESFRKNDTVSTSSTLTLSAAKGESEFGQIILTSTASLDNKTYIVLARDLVHTDGTTVLSRDTVELFNGNYVNITSSYGGLTTGYFVDGLTPFYAAVNYEETKFDRTNGANHAVYARFNIPLNQKAGTYSGVFKIYVVGEGYNDINVQFTVYNFTMYDTESDDVNAQNNFASDFYVKGAGLRAMFDCSSKNYSDEYGELYDYILEYNLNGGELPYDMYYTDNIDGYIVKLVEYYNNPKVRTIRLDLAEGTVSYSYKKTSSSATKEYTVGRVIFEDNWNTSGKTVAGAKTLLKAIAEYCVENDINLFEKFFIGIQGEPGTIEEHLSAVLSYNAIRNSIDYVLNSAGVNWTGHDDIRNSLRTIPILGTTTAFLQITDGYGERVYGMKEGNKLVDNVYYKYAYYKSNAYNEAI
ncbi:MAG: InlB B-repeat-containing protein, partial [Clostridia bacterium]|nr:InlB B-repeat-containing protein [Clostridia bacterium]